MAAPSSALSSLDRLLGDTPDPELYVPSDSMEGALACVEEALRAGEPVAVTGAPGFGKTLLLRLLAARQAAHGRRLYVPFLALPAAEMAPWLLGLLGERPGRKGAAESTLRKALAARYEAGGPTILLVDDAQAIPLETASRLALLQVRAGRALQLVLAGTAGRELDAVLDRLPVPPLHVPLTAPLGQDDVERLIDRMLDQVADDPETRSIAWLGSLDAAELLQASGGVPRELRSVMLQRWLGRGEPDAEVSPVPSYDPFALAAELEEAEPEARAPSPALPRRSLAFRRPLFAGLGAAVALGLALAFLFSGAPAPEADPGASVAGAPAPSPASLAPERGSAVSAAPPILVNVNAFPWARIRVDGRDVGTTPLGNLPLSPGPHRIQARMSDGRELERTVVVGPAERLVSFR